MSSLRIALLAAPFALSFAVGAGQPFGDRADRTADHDAATFAHCAGAVRTTCVVDGDTFWYRGEKVRIADINAPETSEPKCGREAELGRRATKRLTQLLNAGPFTLAAADRDRDRYGRLLRVVTRRGASLGQALVGEGLAESWKGYRGSWC
jgi:endonuclease YncB( thermonuclease family)